VAAGRSNRDWRDHPRTSIVASDGPFASASGPRTAPTNTIASSARIRRTNLMPQLQHHSLKGSNGLARLPWLHRSEASRKAHGPMIAGCGCRLRLGRARTRGDVVGHAVVAATRGKRESSKAVHQRIRLRKRWIPMKTLAPKPRPM